MISPSFFVNKLKQNGIDFFTGVPDSLLKNVCAYLADNLDDRHYVITANEGSAVGLAAGYHLASKKIAVVFMQNSGEGNIINPLASLTDQDVYNIPVLLLIGWRGKPGVHDEPQHVKQGKVTLSLLETMGIEYSVLSQSEDVASKQISTAVDYMKKTNCVYAIVVEKDTFEPYVLNTSTSNNFAMSREEAIKIVAESIGDKDCVVSSTGMISRELFEFREANGTGHERDFLTVGSMGHASQIALGIAIEQPFRKVWCFDGDGAVIMHMGSMSTIAQLKPTNYVHVVFNNGAHDSVGGQPTVGLDISMTGIARAVGYETVISIEDKDTLIDFLGSIPTLKCPAFVEVKVKKGNRKDLGRPTTTPIENKKSLMNYLAK